MQQIANYLMLWRTCPIRSFFVLHISFMTFVSERLRSGTFSTIVKPASFQAYTLDRIVCHQAHFGNADVLQDLCSDAIIAFISLVSQMQVGVLPYRILLREVRKLSFYPSGRCRVLPGSGRR